MVQLERKQKYILITDYVYSVRATTHHRTSSILQTEGRLNYARNYKEYFRLCHVGDL